ncbi:DNA-binding transcriptional regulator, Lrp family [Nocardiopsis flavescens]|uniref:DNA-binding transcriptional regulator, Lrp family n=1 Tax=Nocardiopsis flavescens TaxID=758803 RepID=A0A1M6JIL0_9ACTN|nr:Lrp/AsnC family transcriptional regulator [Nocardiopsis flavescens]SHJ46452.1 DNA-binding transcriptional regulator, Lrp family [Nocardiopsis flavescens]
MAKPDAGKDGSTELDAVDWAILGILQNDATIPNKDIAARVGVAPSTCLQRVRRLRATGVVSSVRAHVDPSRLGRPEQAFIAVQVRPHSREAAEDFVARVGRMPETMAVYNVSGVQDYLVHVAVRDSTHLQSLIIDRLLVLPQVAHCHTQLIFGAPVTTPLRRLPDT